jgi:hypothetical protein
MSEAKNFHLVSMKESHQSSTVSKASNTDVSIEVSKLRNDRVPSMFGVAKLQEEVCRGFRLPFS